MAVLRVREPFSFDEPNGVQRVMRTGDLVDASDPLIKGKEHLFEPVETTVERATAAPGERRSLPKRRARKESAETPADEPNETPEA